MSDAIDIYRAAKLVIDNHRADAALHAMARTGSWLEKATPRAPSSGVRSRRPLRNCSARGGRESR